MKRHVIPATRETFAEKMERKHNRVDPAHPTGRVTVGTELTFDEAALLNLARRNGGKVWISAEEREAADGLVRKGLMDENLTNVLTERS